MIVEREYPTGALDGPGVSTGVEELLGAVDGREMFAGELMEPWSCMLRRRACSSKQGFCIFRLFRLSSPTILQATKFIRRSLGSSIFCVCGLLGLFSCLSDVSFAIALSHFLITVFFPL